MKTPLSFVALILLIQVSFNSLYGRDTVQLAIGDTVHLILIDTLDFPPASLSFQVKSGPIDYAEISLDSISLSAELVSTVYINITVVEGATPGATYDKDVTLLFYNNTDAVSVEYLYTVEVLIPFEAVFTAEPVSGDYPLNAQFSNNSTGNISSYLWDFGDGNTSTEQNPSHIYTMDGIFSVSLIVIGEGESDTLIREDYITVTIPETIADFTSDVSGGNEPLSVSFSDISAGNNSSWQWDFGDGNTSSEQNPNHTYNSSGLYTVSLVVTGDGGTDSITKADYINVFFTGIPNSSTIGVKIFPNPAIDIITIQYSGAGIYKVKITTLKGKEILVVNSSSSSFDIDLSSLNPGIYFVSIVSDRSIETEKIIKQ